MIHNLSVGNSTNSRTRVVTFLDVLNWCFDYTEGGDSWMSNKKNKKKTILAKRW